jgi:two-component system, OmpR family, sensor histidine kinase QseC
VISDSGPLDDGVARHAFERFYRGRGGGPGTGLGLAIVQALAKRRGGRARLESVDEKKVRAKVILPTAYFANS